MFNIICSVDNKYGLGHSNVQTKNGMSWDISKDLKHFKNITTFTESPGKINCIIMGHNTAVAMKSPLKDRYNIVISRTQIDNFTCHESLEKALYDLKNNPNIENIYVIGGAKLIKQALTSPLLKYIYLTKIDHDYNCDITIPELNFPIISISDPTTDIDRNTNEEIVLRFQKMQNNNNGELRYLELMSDIMKGDYRKTRNGNTYSIFGKHLEFDLTKGFPMLTTKKMFLRGIFEELKFFMLGKTDTTELKDMGIKIWEGNTSREFLDEMAKNNSKFKNYKEGDMGPMYGYQWRNFNAPYETQKDNSWFSTIKSYSSATINYLYNKIKGTSQGIDQLQEAIDLLKNDKHSRRIIVTTYNPSQAKDGVLYPCHGIVVQFYVENNKLCCHMYQRSADWFLGCPFNITSYALMTHFIAKIVNLEPGQLVMSFGDMHLYEQHMEQAREQLKRIPYQFPQIIINKNLKSLDDINNLKYEDIKIINYKSHEAIKADMIA